MSKGAYHWWMLFGVELALLTVLPRTCLHNVAHKYDVALSNVGSQTRQGITRSGLTAAGCAGLHTQI